jgi:hypothetical protein
VDGRDRGPRPTKKKTKKPPVTAQRREQNLVQRHKSEKQLRTEAVSSESDESTIEVNEITSKEAAELKKKNAALKQRLQEVMQQKATNRQRSESTNRVRLSSGVQTLFEVAVKQKVCREVKFIANNDELEQVQLKTLRVTEQEWNKVKDLSKEEQQIVVRDYAEVYGKNIAKLVNQKRNGTQQELKKLHDKLRAEGIKITSKMIIHAFCRSSRYVILSEHDTCPDREANIEHNRRNKKLRDNMDIIVDRILPAAVGYKNWGPCHRSLMPMSHPRDRVYAQTFASPELIPDGNYQITAADQALTAAMWENCEEKWGYHMDMKLAEQKPDPKHESYNKALYSSSSSGSSLFGGWTVEGRKRFAGLRAMFAKARLQEHCGRLELQVCTRLFKANGFDKQSKKKKTKVVAKDQEDGAVGFAIDLKDVKLVEDSDDLFDV